ncbi:hypothetical protein [Endozoicomonas arenosclerae]|uniref:hypothetical protein n=1 Tax=Endozoicomonas arenosclerae TaxID=1633495 RepID=UPI000783E535|nr:hypothetical protein [Endozoicomonas arenosclerae]
MPFYHYVCKVTESIHGLELKQENDQIFCEYLAPDGAILLTSSFAPAFSEHQEIKEVADKFINTNRGPSRWIFKSKGLCYLHAVVPLQEHCLKTRQAVAESGSGMMSMPDQPSESPVTPEAPTEQPGTTIDIPATAGGVVIIAGVLLLIAAFFVEANYHCVLKGCTSLYNRVQLSIP